MARPTFAELLTDLRIPENIQQVLLDEQYDTESFGLVALSLNDLDSVLDSMSVDLSYRARSSLRVHRMLQVHRIPQACFQVTALSHCQALAQVHLGMNLSPPSLVRISSESCVTTLNASTPENCWIQISCHPVGC